MSQPAKGKIPGFPGINHQETPAPKDGPVFTLHAGKKSNKFISHLLGLDHEHPGGAVSGSSEKTATLKGVKFSDFFQGIKLTPNFMFFLLFLGFFLWLFVIYWVRHHEPLANQVLGSSKAHPQKSALDRRLVAGVKGAFPVQTSATTGEVYVPNAHEQAALPAPTAAQHAAHPGQQAIQGSAQTFQALPQAAQQALPQVIQQNQPIPGAYGTPYANSIPLAGTAAQSPSTFASAYATQAPAAAALHSSHGSYMVGVQTESGTRVKTIVSR